MAKTSHSLKSTIKGQKATCVDLKIIVVLLKPQYGDGPWISSISLCE